jgi:Xaa-Pro aminopeptidase
VRIEDDVLVTSDGCLTYTNAPRTVAEIEEVMRHE